MAVFTEMAWRIIAGVWVSGSISSTKRRISDAPLPADGLRRHGRAGRAGAAERTTAPLRSTRVRLVWLPSITACPYFPGRREAATSNIELLVGMGRQDRHPPAGHKLLRPAVLLPRRRR